MKSLADARPARLDPPGTPPLTFALTEMPEKSRRFRAAALIPAGGLAAAAAATVAVLVIGSGRRPAGRRRPLRR
ncbi:hypothetical protein [Paractinoplanes durhamensis]|uniref:hypothetical protein n=1 Tax=Paractinoplanes durhamensis TaxID=113563 RepID=UPI0036252B4C